MKYSNADDYMVKIQFLVYLQHKHNIFLYDYHHLVVQSLKMYYICEILIYPGNRSLEHIWDNLDGRFWLLADMYIHSTDNLSREDILDTLAGRFQRHCYMQIHPTDNLSCEDILDNLAVHL